MFLGGGGPVQLSHFAVGVRLGSAGTGRGLF